jgi:CheY-like chemotaxis protein
MPLFSQVRQHRPPPDGEGIAGVSLKHLLEPFPVVFTKKLMSVPHQEGSMQHLAASTEGYALQSLEAIVTAALQRFRALLPADIDLAVDYFCEDPHVRADAGQLEEALLSVLIISWQSMAGVTDQIVVSLQEVLLEGGTLNKGAHKKHGGLPPKSYGWLSVSNSSREALSNFHQLLPPPGAGDDRAASARRLQVAEVQDIIAAHQGMMTVSTEPGRGTAFEIHLPTVLAAGARPASASAEAIKHIIYVDDYEAMRALISETLPDAGFRVTCFESGPKALAAIKADPQGCDAVVTDYQLLGFSGLDLLTEIKRIRPDLPTIIISGYVDASLKTKAKALGALLVISKSRDLNELYHALRQVLWRRPTHPALGPKKA